MNHRRVIMIHERWTTLFTLSPVRERQQVECAPSIKHSTSPSRFQVLLQRRLQYDHRQHACENYTTKKTGGKSSWACLPELRLMLRERRARRRRGCSGRACCAR